MQVAIWNMQDHAIQQNPDAYIAVPMSILNDHNHIFSAPSVP